MNKIIINWKMMMQSFQINEFLAGLNTILPDNWIILPSVIGMVHLLQHKKNRIPLNQMGLQEVGPLAFGDYTGKNSFLEAKEIGLDYILVNHYEVVQDSEVAKISKYQNHKMNNLISYGMSPILCLGTSIKTEMPEDFETDLRFIIKSELEHFFDGVEFFNDSKVILVYMPTYNMKNNVKLDNESITIHMDIVKEEVRNRFGIYLEENHMNIVYGGLMKHPESYDLTKHGLFLDQGYDLEQVFYWMDYEAKINATAKDVIVDESEK